MYKREFRKFDYTLFAAVAALSILGIILIGSATGVGQGNFDKTFISQIIWFITGIGIMALASFVDFRFICKFYIPIYVLDILLIVATLVIKKVTGDAWVREIRIGDIVGIMPSEFNKIFLLIFLATLIDKFQDRINSFWILCLITATGVVPFLLIAMQPSLSAALVSIVILVTMLFIGKISYKYIITGAVVAVLAGGFLYYDINSENPVLISKIFTKYQIEDRIMPYLNPELAEDASQTEQAIFAIGSGGITGKGLYNNTTVVYEASNDFIFAILGAEFGFVGCVAVLGISLFIILKCLIISMKSDIFIGRLISGGVACIFAFQVIVNVGVNTGLLPNTGMAYPFLSSGGSTMWINMSLIGLCINVRMTKQKSMFGD